MKKLYDIRINSKKPSSAEVAKYKNFDALLKEYDNTKKQSKVVPLRSLSFKRWALVAASFVAFVFVTYAIQQVVFKDIFNLKTTKSVVQPYINPPLKTVETKFFDLEVDAQIGGEFTMNDGTKIFIPKNAFVDMQGTVIGGMVVLRYYKYQDIADIFLSGISMQYDSANIQYNMGSSGMMALYGDYKGSPINIHPSKNLAVQLVAQANLSNINDYNVYQLNTKAKNWDFVALDEVRIEFDEATNKRIEAALAESEIVKNLAKANLQLKQLETQKATVTQQFEQHSLPIKPTKPHQPDPNNFVLDLDLSAFASDPDFESGGVFHDTTMYNSNAFLAQYAGMMWEVSANQKTAYDLAISDIEWQNVKLEKVDNQRFRLKLSNGSKKVTLVVMPILSSKELAQLNEKYQEQLTIYNRQLTEYEQKIEPKLERLDAEYDEQITNLETEITNLQRSYNKIRIEAMRTMNLDLNNQKIVNQFKINQFGVWNCDKPEPSEKRTVQANFQDADGKPVNYYMVYVADKNNGQVQRFYTNQKTEISYNPKSDNVLWLVSKDGQIAVAKSSEFQKIGTQKYFTFTLEKTKEHIENKEAVKRILGL